MTFSNIQEFKFINGILKTYNVDKYIITDKDLCGSYRTPAIVESSNT